MEERKTALVTGADRGLGFSVTKGLLQEGWRVFAGQYLADYGLLEALAEEWDTLTILPQDVSKSEDIRAAAETIEIRQQIADIFFPECEAAFRFGSPVFGKEDLIEDLRQALEG